MAKAPITNRVKGKIWTDTMTIDFDGNIAGAVDTCFRALKVEHMEKAIERMKAIFEARKAHAAEKPNPILSDDVMKETRS